MTTFDPSGTAPAVQAIDPHHIDSASGAPGATIAPHSAGSQPRLNGIGSCACTNRPAPLRPSCYLLASRMAWATLVACEMRPMRPGGTRLRLRELTRGRMASWGVASAEGRCPNFAARYRTRAARAASTCAVRASIFCRRSSSLLTLLRAAAKSYLRRRGSSAVPGKLLPRASALPRASRCFCLASACALLR